MSGFERNDRVRELGGWRRPIQSSRRCLTCGYDVYADPSRIRWVFRMHVERCTTATPEERAVFKRTFRWPRKKK